MWMMSDDRRPNRAKTLVPLGKFYFASGKRITLSMAWTSSV